MKLEDVIWKKLETKEQILYDSVTRKFTAGPLLGSCDQQEKNSGKTQKYSLQ
jgi:hypothetical protein